MASSWREYNENVILLAIPSAFTKCAVKEYSDKTGTDDALETLNSLIAGKRSRASPTCHWICAFKSSLVADFPICIFPKSQLWPRNGHHGRSPLQGRRDGRPLHFSRRLIASWRRAGWPIGREPGSQPVMRWRPLGPFLVPMASRVPSPLTLAPIVLEVLFVGDG